MRGIARKLILTLAAASGFCAASIAAAHSLPTNTIMNAFVRIEPSQAQLVVRIPLDLVPGLPLPQRGAEYDLSAADAAVQLALLTLPQGFLLLENGHRLTPTRVSGRFSPPSDRSFEHFDSARIAADQPTSSTVSIPFGQGFFDLHLVYPIASASSVFTIQTEVAADLKETTKLAVRYSQLQEPTRALYIPGASAPVALNPTWYAAAGSFIELGVEHILTGIDHLLFLFCLVIPFRRWRGLISVITAFTVAHSITLFASAFHLAPQGSWFPPLVETAIATSIVYMALENMAGPNLKRRWLITGMFGLVHGFGFSNALGQSLQFAGSYLLSSLLAFNIGIEIGQLAMLALMLPTLALLRRWVPDRVVVLALSSIAAVIGGRWFVERWQALEQLGWPHLGASAVIGALSVVIVCGVAFYLFTKRTRRTMLSLRDRL
jgi:hypothetical protein